MGNLAFHHSNESRWLCCEFGLAAKSTTLAQPSSWPTVKRCFGRETPLTPTASICTSTNMFCFFSICQRGLCRKPDVPSCDLAKSAQSQNPAAAHPHSRSFPNAYILCHSKTCTTDPYAEQWTKAQSCAKRHV